MNKEHIVITGMARTPMGSFQGCLSTEKAPDLGSIAIKGAIKKANIKPEDIDDVVMGCVLPAGMGQAPARQAAINAGIPNTSGATTINKMCGSGMRAAMIANDQLLAGSSLISLAGGIESMSNAPYILPKVRDGLRMGHGQVQDHMFIDGLEDAYEPGRLMGSYAEATAEAYQFTREEQDNFAIRSLKRAKKANEDGSFEDEMVPVTIKTRKGSIEVTSDEQPFNADINKIPNLKPAFSKDGTVTAANSSSISDGAAALVMMTMQEAEKKDSKPLAKIIAHATNSHDPAWFTTAPIGAIKKVLDKAEWDIKDVGLFEINEAFAVVPMAAMKDLSISPDIVNIHGGACALGHPVGTSGARIMATLISAMHKYKVDKGIASLCIGGGEATAIALERC
ncbi:MAG: acetyl-CoA C-acyltransferase [Pelagibacterales bacterium]|nr:acetyl-CoA C-acyltransferase [Pelagibacterales bacterium]RCL83598.1 MAG: acetyl-CoA C-acyltransferase [Alphaproteobacteria bacterium]|tara:strand:+ start:3446 stop:4630 length:1185 start_codon:yes stop_codon:yes gene_type:complete